MESLPGDCVPPMSVAALHKLHLGICIWEHLAATGIRFVLSEGQRPLASLCQPAVPSSAASWWCLLLLPPWGLPGPGSIQHSGQTRFPLLWIVSEGGIRGHSHFTTSPSLLAALPSTLSQFPTSAIELRPLPLIGSRKDAADPLLYSPQATRSNSPRGLPLVLSDASSGFFNIFSSSRFVLCDENCLILS